MMMRPATTPRGRPAGGRLSSHASARFERRGAGGQDRLEVVKDLFSLGPRVLGDGVVQRVGPKQRGHVDPAPGLDGLRHRPGVRRRAVSVDDLHETSRMGCGSAADTVGAAALPGHHQLAFCPEPLQVAGQHVFGMGERVGVLGGGFEHQLVALRPDGPGAVGEYQPSAVALAVNRLDGVLAAQMGFLRPR
jgi:hypothetical protein